MSESDASLPHAVGEESREMAMFTLFGWLFVIFGIGMIVHGAKSDRE